MTKTPKTLRSLVLAAAAVLTLGAAAVATSTDALAFGARGGFHGGFHGYHVGHSGYRWSHYRWGYRPYRYGYRPYHWYRYSHRWPSHHCYFYRNCGFGPGYVSSGLVGGAPAAGPAPMMQAAAAGPGRPPCLAKQYGPDGSVMFMDRCTQESAVSPPPGAQGPQGPEPQGPAPQQQ